MSDGGLAHFKDCKNLTDLRLNNMQVSDAGLAVLTGLPKLGELHLRDSRISREGVGRVRAALLNCKIEWSEPNRTAAEQVLALGGVVEIATPGKDDVRPVKAADVLPKEFFQVRRISVKGVKKPLDELLAALSQLKFAAFDRLESIDLRDTKASAAGIDRLRQALPTCRIQWDGGP